MSCHTHNAPTIIPVVPRSVLVPEGWASKPDEASFRYSHPGARGRTFLVRVRKGPSDSAPVEVLASVVRVSDLSPVAL